MNGFSLEIPADPRWLHLARSVVLTAVGVSDVVPADLDGLALAVGEALLELSTTPGVNTISATFEPALGDADVQLVGRGESIAPESLPPLLELILGAGARGFRVDGGDSEYGFTLPLGSRQP
jgi:hypothetical protein